MDGTLAQLVEQRTENPCVRRSIRRGATSNRKDLRRMRKSFFIEFL